jgi:hypothetical protein
MNSVKIVEDFWTAVWKSRNPDAILLLRMPSSLPRVLMSGKDKFTAWAWNFLAKINDSEFEVFETFQNESGSRVASSAMEIGIDITCRHGADLGFVPIVVREACGAGHQDAADRALLTLEFLGDTVLTDLPTVRTAMNSPVNPAG